MSQYTITCCITYPRHITTSRPIKFILRRGSFYRARFFILTGAAIPTTRRWRKIECTCIKSHNFQLSQLFATRVQAKPQVTKLFPVMGGPIVPDNKQLNNTTKPLDRFLEKLRATYNFVFHQSENNVSHVERILTRNASNTDLQTLRLIWANPSKPEDYANLKYPDNSLLDQVISLSTLKKYEVKPNSSLKKNSSVEIKSTIKANDSNTSSSESSPNKTKTLSDDNDWFRDVEALELQDEELNDKNEVDIASPGTTLQFPTTVGRHLVEWLGTLFGLTYKIYTKLSAAANCSDGNAIK